METGENVQRADRGSVVAWDLGDTSTLYGGVLGIEVTRAEVKLLFGGGTVHGEKDGKAINVSDRIILNPYTAKRLHVLLRRIMARHHLPIVTDSNDMRVFKDTSN